jgi:hypothetical protein
MKAPSSAGSPVELAAYSGTPTPEEEPRRDIYCAAPVLLASICSDPVPAGPQLTYSFSTSATVRVVSSIRA